MAGGDDASRLETGVWWDLNTCPVPAGVDPLCVRRCIETALEKKIGRASAVSIYAMGNLEYICSYFLEQISYSGIILIHAPCSVMELYGFLEEWSTSMITTEGSKGYTMLISDDFRIADPCLFQLFPGFTNFCAYPKDGRLLPLAEQRDPIVLANEFVWETLLFDNYAYTGDMTVREPLYICNLFDCVPLDDHKNPKHFCQVCNYLAFDNYNLLLHTKSEEHNRKAQEEDCKSRKRSPQLDLVGQRNKMQSLERGKQ
ncbi:hypothetical protein DY000_02038570 [Brassica cretica]|uniref:NYN domain-containing protein n=1 Tax=Brassica cretica TaxID=69181 RepID=A0ABQ7BG86_BRACR|nr:hypothetical protein DY000_02038570 [Brassica cretica]